MQITNSAGLPFDSILHWDEEITVTSTRIETEDSSYAIKYVSSLRLDAKHPPRGTAMAALLLCLFAILVVLIYLVTGKVSGTGFALLLVGPLVVAAIAASIRWLMPSDYTLDLALVNGETFRIRRKTEAEISAIQNAIKAGVALTRQDATIG